MYILKTFEIFKNLISKEIKHRVSQIGEIGIFPQTTKKYINLFNQEYIGNITIYPPFFLSKILNVIENPKDRKSLDHFVFYG